MSRPIYVTLMQNLGTGLPGGNVLYAGPGNLSKLGSSSWSLDEGSQLTKCSAGDFTIEIEDPVDTIWTFVTGSLATTGGLLPPYMQLLVDGQQAFIGIVDPNRIVQNQNSSTHSVEISAQDWSVQLANQYLDGSVNTVWTRPVPKVANSRSAVTNLTGYSIVQKYLAKGYCPNSVVIPGTNWCCKGDKMTCSLTGSTVYTVLNVTYPVIALDDQVTPPGGPFTRVDLDMRPWPVPSFTLGVWSSGVDGFGNYYNTYTPDPSENTNYSATFVRQASSTTDANYYTVSTAVGANPSPACYTIGLNTVNGVTMGDKLHLIQGTSQSNSWTVLSVNPELNQVTTLEQVTNLSIGNRIYFDNDTQNELVFTDARTVLQNATQPFSLDLSRFVQASTVNPVYGYLPIYQYGTSGTDLTAASDIQPTLTAMQIISGTTAQYLGTPDAGWAAPVAPSLTADWTSQKTSAPSSLMPYEIKTLSVYARRRNRVYNDMSLGCVDNGPDPSSLIDTWTPAIGATQAMGVFYDYIGMRKITNSGATINGYAWSGSSFGGAVGITWPSASIPRQIINFPGGPTTTSLLAYTTVDTIELGFYGSAGVVSAAVPVCLKGGQLVTTPYGPYLIGPQGYGQITYSASVLTITWAYFPDQITCLWPNTFVARNSNEMLVFGRLDDITSSTDINTQTWLFRLTAVPNNTSQIASINFSEQIQDGTPVFAGAIRDPSKSGRIVGHMGGCVFSIDTVMPWVIERFTPGGLTAIDCIEHICMLQGAMAVPMPSGKLAIVSRINSDSVTALTGVQRSDAKAYLGWPNFYSSVLVETQDGNYYAETDGQIGGTVMTVTAHPMIWHISQAQACADALSAWFGKPRSLREETWFWNDPLTPSPWESLSPFSLVTVNGSIQYRLMSKQTDYVTGETQVTLVAN